MFRLMLSGVACFISVVASAQTFPTRPVRIIVPYAAGGAVETVARAVGGKLSETWSQTVVIENRPGGARGARLVHAGHGYDRERRQSSCR